MPGQVFLFETRAAYLDVSKFYGSAISLTASAIPRASVPFLGDACFETSSSTSNCTNRSGKGWGCSFVSGTTPSTR